MNNTNRRVKPRSYIFDVPTSSYIHSPMDEENDIMVSKVLASYGTSRISGSKQVSRKNSLFLEDSTQDLTDRQLEFNITFLPYIYAQNGYNKLRSILKAFSHKTSTDSLPIARKPREFDILQEGEGEKSEKENLSNEISGRVKSMEMAKLNLDRALL